jgi:hypothetical protein
MFRNGNRHLFVGYKVIIVVHCAACCCDDDDGDTADFCLVSLLDTIKAATARLDYTTGSGC